MLRLFAIELLFKIRLATEKKRYFELKQTNFDEEDLENSVGLKCIFLTASPVLTNEIQRYYKKMTSNIKAELHKKKERKIAEEKKQ